MNNSIKTTLAVLLIGSLGAGGIAVVARANSGNGEHQVFISQGVEEKVEMEDERESEANEELEEKQEAARLQPLAKITTEQAKEAALQVQSGEVKEVELEAEEGSLVYEVTVGKTEVFVDAGNGKVLYTQGVDEEVDEATEQARPQGSIQVPDGDNYQ